MAEGEQVSQGGPIISPPGGDLGVVGKLWVPEVETDEGCSGFLSRGPQHDPREGKMLPVKS